MNAIELQQQLFTTIKGKIPDHLSAPEEIARMLGVSVDSVYRRMRGEKAIALDELHMLCDHYKISLDQMMNIQTGSFLFQGNLLDSETFRFDAYLTGVMHNMAYFNSFKEKEFYYLCKDVPLFQHFHSREFAAFKYYFYMKTLVGFPEFKNKKISFDEYPDSLFEMSKKIFDIYYQLNVHEFWNYESLNSTLRQIEYYVEGRMFQSNEDAIKVYEALERFFNHIEKQAELGYRFKEDDPDKTPIGKFSMYVNETVLLDNNILVILDGVKLVIVPHSAVNYMMSRDIKFTENFYRYIKNMEKRSTMVSQVSEKERARFFKHMRDKIQSRKHAMKF
ncbi:MAG: helix-turn-helix transcriptional regulator [Chitinophagaceae bacterium]